jgi:hypothetical protein
MIGIPIMEMTGNVQGKRVFPEISEAMIRPRTDPQTAG